MAVYCQYEVLVFDVDYSWLTQDFVDLLPIPLAVFLPELWEVILVLVLKTPRKIVLETFNIYVGITKLEAIKNFIKMHLPTCYWTNIQILYILGLDHISTEQEDVV